MWVPYHFLFGRRSFDFPPTTRPTADADAAIDTGPVRPETRAAVLNLLSDQLERPIGEAEAQPETRLDQLGLDSLDRMKLSLEVERQFGFTGEEACETVLALLG